MKIINANIFTAENTFHQGEVFIEKETIQSVHLTDEISQSNQKDVIDLSNHFLVPGFIELQLNGGFGMDFTSSPHSIWKVAEKMPRFGVTSFLPTIITSPLDTVAAAQVVVMENPGNDFCGACPLGLHVEGPFLNPIKKGTHSENLLLEPSIERIQNWTAEKGIRLVTLAPELPNALPVIRELVKRGIVVSAGHSNATYEQAIRGFEAGITYGTHIFNAQSPLQHREPGLVGALLEKSTIPVGIVPDGIHVHPAAVDIVWQLKGSKYLTLVTDALVGLGMPPGYYTFGDFKIIVDEEIAKKPDGTISGSILGEDKALRNLIKFTGCSLEQALPTLTSTPARVLGLPDRGKIQVGYKADLLVLDSNLEVVTTIASGKIAYRA